MDGPVTWDLATDNGQALVRVRWQGAVVLTMTLEPDQLDEILSDFDDARDCIRSKISRTIRYNGKRVDE